MQARRIFPEQITPSTTGFEMLWKLVSYKTKSELKQLWNLTEDKTPEELAVDSLLRTGLENLVLEFKPDQHVKIEKIIGGGHWSFVFLVREIESGDKYVLKMMKPPQKSLNPIKNPFHELSENVVNVNQQFDKESVLNKNLYGKSEVRHLALAGRTISFVLIPFLGEKTLDSLLLEEPILKRITLSEWLEFFIKVLTKLNEFHHKTGYVHNDVKPPNITLTTQADSRGFYTFSLVELIDFGNAQLPFEHGVIGDPNYNPVLESFAAVVLPIKSEKLDIFALGKSLLEVIDVLRRYHHHELDQEMLTRCEAIFLKMVHSLPSKRISLDKGVEWLSTCRDDYVLVELQKNEEMAEELNALLAKLKDKQKQREQKTQCCATVSGQIHTLWHKVRVSKNPPLKTRISATEKMLRLIAGDENVVLSDQQFEALEHGDLGRIIDKHRLRGKLPELFVERERTSISSQERPSLSM